MNLKKIFKKGGKSNPEVDNLPEIWDEYCQLGYRYISKLRCFRKLFKIIEKFLIPVQKGVVLDAGCGTGAMFKLIIERIQPAKIVGVDWSENMLEEAEKNAEKFKRSKSIDFEFKRMDLTKSLPWSENSFDAVVSNLTLCYFPPKKWQEGVKEIYRVLKPGAYTYISIMLKGWDFPKMIKDNMMREFLANPVICFLAFKVKKSSEKINKCVELGLIEHPEKEEFLNFLKQIGFKEIENEKIFWGAGIAIRARK